MSQITLHVGGKSFAIACQPGDEDHVLKLGGWIDAKFQQLAPDYSQNLLFATLQLADDLHRAQQDWAKAREEADAAINGNEETQREAKLALGRQDQYRARIAELEEELDRMQSAAQQEGNKHNDLMADNERYKIAVMEADAENSRLKAEIATMRRDVEAMEELVNAQASSAAAATGPAPVAAGLFINPASPSADPDLAPSLERFAEMLEKCVVKLESALPAP